ncbi:MAG TPA: NAD(P)-binding domain-containing protein [Terriglobales bacterium]|nr:NAD(P)-binding domain-containing protein [Terriglobales bacterium]
MKIGILGTGIVGSTLGSKFIEFGHDVKMGSRTTNNEDATKWAESNGAHASCGSFGDASSFGEIVFNCTAGNVSLAVAKLAGFQNLKGKVLVDVSNPLDFSKGMPPTLTVCNTDSIGEQLQRTLIDTKVVKALNTMNCKVMVAPSLVPGEHNLFMAGNDDQAKQKVRNILKTFGWKDSAFIDLGDITAARGMEMILPIWMRLYGLYPNQPFNFRIAK